MSLLGEISKNSEALRYHAKTAEIAGQNLAHVNDETYARQRVLAREGVMYGSFGELQTSGLEAAGLDHARSELLDKRVVNELSETASLEARKEILDLLQGALGETITRSGINVGLDDLHDSDLAPGSLTRALNDFFNAFQELSASPDEPTIKQELFNKVGTLVKRFNDAGSSLDSIEEDLSETVRRSVDDVNRVLAQLHEVNKQVRRFELQDKGKAVTYRDRRQALLEELSQLMDFKVEEDVDPQSGLPSGFINLYVQGSANEKVNLLDPMGPKNITNDWGQEFVIAAPSDPNGTQAKVRAKIDADGNLGRFEVLDGGSLYNDSEGPILVSLLPPKPTTNLLETETGEVVSAPKSGTVEEVFVAQGDEVKQGDPLVNVAVDGDETVAQAEANNVAGQAAGIDAPVDDGNELSSVTGGSVANTVPFLSEVARMQGDVFYQGDAYYQALTNTQKGDDVSDTLKFMKITTWPNGQVQEIKKRHSDIESFQQGEQIYYEGKYLQATAEVSAISEELGTNGLASRTYLAGEVIKYKDTYYQAFQNLEKGTDLSQILSTTNQAGTEGQAVKGNWEPGEYALDDYTYYAGTWHKVVSAENSASDIPQNPSNTDIFDVSNAYTAEDAAKNDQERIIIAQAIMSGTFDSNSDYQAGQVVQQGSNFFEFNEASVTALGKNWVVDNYAEGDVVRYQGIYYQTSTAITSQETPIPQGENIFDDQTPDISVNWVTLGSDLTALGDAGVTIPTNVTNEVVNEVTIPISAGKYFRESAFQATDEVLGEPLATGDQALGSLWVIGQNLPSVTNSKLEGTADENDKNSYSKGELISSLNSNNKPIYYLTVADVPSGEVPDFANSDSFVRINSFVDSDVKALNRGQASLQFFDDEVYYDEETQQHFVVDSSPAIISDPSQIASFDPSDSQWSSNFHVFKPKLNSIDDPTSFIRKISSSGHDTGNGVLQEVNIGIAEAVVKNGEITTFNIINSGNSFPSSDAIFSDGIELNLSAGSIHGYQAARSNEMERFRTNLNDLVSNFVTKVNDIYNPDDNQGGYLFGFDAFLTRPVTGNNLIMEEEYGLYGVEGNGELQLFREEVNMTLPTAESDTFTIVNTTPIFPEEVPNQALIRESDELKLFLDDPNNVDIYQFYSSARRMQHVTLELDTTYPGEDKLTGTDDDGRSLLLGYETIPFRIEQGEKAFIIGDNFSFDAVLQNDWNLASSLRVENDLTVENLKSTHDFAEGANDVAFAIGDLANEGSFTDHISTMNADIGNSLSDLNDNLEHQKSLETLLLDQRRAVSSVSIDEEVSDLMQFQRSFQASARVLNTLDKMLELVVLGLVK